MKLRHRFLRGTMTAAFLLGGIVVAAVAPSVLRAQTSAQADGLADAWREEIGAQLDQQLARLAAPTANSPAIAAPATRGEERGFTVQPIVSGAFLPARREPWLPAVANILGEHGLPASLLGMAAVESGFNPAALSPKGARGLWQLMPETARRYGLAVEAGRDDRLDPVKSTHAAARYMNDLYAQFQDWPLTLAAYNAGENRVERALERRGAGDFWTLSRQAALPDETRRYVPAVLGKSTLPYLLAAPAGVGGPDGWTSRNAASSSETSRATPGRVIYATGSWEASSNID